MGNIFKGKIKNKDGYKSASSESIGKCVMAGMALQILQDSPPKLGEVVNTKEKAKSFMKQLRDLEKE